MSKFLMLGLAALGSAAAFAFSAAGNTGSDLSACAGCMQAARAEKLAKYDANKDGKLDKAEFPGTDEAFVAADADKDGALSAAEFWSVKVEEKDDAKKA